MVEHLEVRRLLASVIGGILTIDGTAGNDTITLSFDSGTSELVVQVNSNMEERFPDVGITGGLINAGNGNDTVTIGTTIANTTVNGGAGNDVLTDNSSADTMNGEDGNDSLTGNNGNDSLTGGAGNDTLRGGNGNDRIVGGVGDDSIFGDDGNDQLVGDAGSNIVSGGLGRDRYEALSDTRDLSITLDNVANDGASGETGNIMSDVENLYGGSGNDLLSGSFQRNFIRGMGGNDSIKGQSKSDTLYGGDGNDVIEGYRDDDVIFGEAGNDTLVGNQGTDTLDGGTGTDVNGYTADIIDLVLNIP